MVRVVEANIETGEEIIREVDEAEMPKIVLPAKAKRPSIEKIVQVLKAKGIIANESEVE